MADLHKRELIRVVARYTGRNQDAVEDVMNALVAVIAVNLSNDDAVVWTGLGRFEMHHRAEKRGVDPRTGAAITITAAKRPRCQIGTAFRQHVDMLLRHPEEVAAD